MERLSDRALEILNDLHRERLDYNSEYLPLVEALNRLSEYEDTQLPPDVCAEYKTFEDEAVSKNVTFKRIIELMEAESSGKLVELPCKAGDTVWEIFCDKVYPAKVEHIDINAYTNPPIWVQVSLGFCSPQRFRWDLSCGKDFFLTREEAEAALKEGNNGGEK